jgi:hypothetical protein
MKQTRIISLISCFAVAVYFLIFCFADSIAQPPEPPERMGKCISCCTYKKDVCYNLNPDRRLCEAEFQNCVATCKSEGEISSDWSECWSQSE